MKRGKILQLDYYTKEKVRACIKDLGNSKQVVLEVDLIKYLKLMKERLRAWQGSNWES